MSINQTSFADINREPKFSQQEIGEVCIANISPYERRKRLKFALQQFIGTLALLAIFMALDLHPLWRVSLFFLFSSSTVSFFQSRDKT